MNTFPSLSDVCQYILRNVVFFTLGKGSSKFFLPGATAAVLAMLGALHARRMYDDKKVSHAFVRFTYSIKYPYLNCFHKQMSGVWNSFSCKVIESKDKGIEPQFSPDVKVLLL
jgi:hypothetical protein